LYLFFEVVVVGGGGGAAEAVDLSLRRLFEEEVKEDMDGIDEN